MAVSSFEEILDAIEQLPEDAQVDLADILRRRLIARGREQMIEQVRGVRAEFAEGKAQPMTAAEIVRRARP